jgi:hypothetical protein
MELRQSIFRKFLFAAVIAFVPVGPAFASDLAAAAKPAMSAVLRNCWSLARIQTSGLLKMAPARGSARKFARYNHTSRQGRSGMWSYPATEAFALAMIEEMRHYEQR